MATLDFNEIQNGSSTSFTYGDYDAIDFGVLDVGDLSISRSSDGGSVVIHHVSGGEVIITSWGASKTLSIKVTEQIDNDETETRTYNLVNAEHFTGTEGNPFILGTGSADNLIYAGLSEAGVYGGIGSDVLNSISSKYTIIDGGDGDDVLRSFNDTGTGLLGDDGDDVLTIYGNNVHEDEDDAVVLEGDAGNDTYKIMSKLEAGSKVIIEQNHAGINDNDRLVLAKMSKFDVASEGLDGDDYVLTFTNGAKIIIQEWQKNALSKIIYNDGVLEYEKDCITINGESTTFSNQDLYGTEGADTIVIQGGSEGHIDAGAGDDTITISIGNSGWNYIVTGEGSDTVDIYWQSGNMLDLDLKNIAAGDVDTVTIHNLSSLDFDCTYSTNTTVNVLWLMGQKTYGELYINLAGGETFANNLKGIYFEADGQTEFLDMNTLYTIAEGYTIEDGQVYSGTVYTDQYNLLGNGKSGWKATIDVNGISGDDALWVKKLNYDNTCANWYSFEGTVSGNDLVLTFKDLYDWSTGSTIAQADTLTLKDYFASEANTDKVLVSNTNTVDYFSYGYHLQYAATTVDYSQRESSVMSVMATNANNITVTGTEYGDYFVVHGNNNKVIGGGGADIFVVADGNNLTMVGDGNGSTYLFKNALGSNQYIIDETNASETYCEAFDKINLQQTDKANVSFSLKDDVMTITDTSSTGKVVLEGWSDFCSGYCNSSSINLSGSAISATDLQTAFAQTESAALSFSTSDGGVSETLNYSISTGTDGSKVLTVASSN